MDTVQLRQALRQTLENYQRCGLARVPRLALDELPDDVLANLAAWAQPGETSSQPAAVPAPTNSAPTNPAPASPTPAGDPAAAAVAVDAAPAPAPAAAPAPAPGPARAPAADLTLPGRGLAREPWSLPVLELEQRQAQFESLAAMVRDCRKCGNIVSYRQQTVFGDGTLQPSICFMGEAPGADEDRLGKPFVGKAGQLLTKIIAAMQLRREDVYILNALKCRPPQNRTPVPEEIEHCRHFVESQLDVLQPKYIVCLGAMAVRSILQSDLPIGRLRGRFHSYRGAKVVVTYHPSYLLRQESAKRMVWEDMKMLLKDMGTPL